MAPPRVGLRGVSVGVELLLPSPGSCCEVTWRVHTGRGVLWETPLAVFTSVTRGHFLDVGVKI